MEKLKLNEKETENVIVDDWKLENRLPKKHRTFRGIRDLLLEIKTFLDPFPTYSNLIPLIVKISCSIRIEYVEMSKNFNICDNFYINFTFRWK